MPSHPWLQKIDSTALCPKCNATALKRSHAKTPLDKVRKKYSPKRRFRCHACGWSGWMDETKLRYPVSKRDVALRASNVTKDSIPQFELDDTTKKEGQKESHIQSGHKPRQAETSNSLQGENSGDLALDPSQLMEPEKSIASRFVPLDFHHESRHKGIGCPACGTLALHRSRHRGWKENFRKMFSRKRPYRCHKCGWRGWIVKHF